MIRCSIKPYEGREKFIFISYAHRDSEQVYSIVEGLAEKGYRIWYDEGIEPGEEWPEIIAEHLNNCEACISFLSENYLESPNCRREINFALRKEKSLVTVVLEPVEMSLGMEMQLSATQFVLKYLLPNEEAFYEKLCGAKILTECRMEQEKILAEEENILRSWLIRIKTGEYIELREGEFKLGRDPSNDYVITGNRSVGRMHACIVAEKNQYAIIDKHSKNRTFLNGMQLEPEKEYTLQDGDLIHVANERFSFHQEEGMTLLQIQA